MNNRLVANSASTRLEAVKLSEEIGPVKTAEIFQVNRKTITRWIQQYQKGGQSSLQNRSRVEQQHPKKICVEIRESILNCKITNPDFSIKDIINHLHIDYSKTAVGRVLRRAKLTESKAFKAPESAVIYRHYIRSYQLLEAKGEYTRGFLYCLELYPAGLFCCAYSSEKSRQNSVIFLSAALNMLHKSKTFDGICFSEPQKADSPLTAAAARFGIKVITTIPETGYKYEVLLKTAEDILQNSDCLAKDALVCASIMLNSQVEADSPVLYSWLNFPFVNIDKYLSYYSLIKTGSFNWFTYLNMVVSSPIEILQLYSRVLIKQNKAAEAIEVLNTAIIFSSQKNFEEQQARFLINKGLLVQKQGQNSNALNCFKASSKLAEKSKNRKLLLESFHQLGVQYHVQLDFMESFRCHRKVYLLAGRSREMEAMFKAATNIGLLHQSLYNYKSARLWLIKAWKLAVRMDDLLQEVRSLINLGSLCLQEEKLNTAASYFIKALPLSSKLPQLLQHTMISINLGIIEYKSGHYQKAHEYYRQAESYCTSNYDVNLILPLLQNQTSLLMSEGKLRDAITINNRMEQLGRKSGNVNTVIYAKINRISIYDYLGRKKELRAKINEALEECQKNNLNFFRPFLLLDLVTSSIEKEGSDFILPLLKEIMKEAELLKHSDLKIKAIIYQKIAEYYFRCNGKQDADLLLKNLCSVIDSCSTKERVNLYGEMYRFFKRTPTLASCAKIIEFYRLAVISGLKKIIPRHDTEAYKNILNGQLR